MSSEKNSEAPFFEKASLYTEYSEKELKMVCSAAITVSTGIGLDTQSNFIFFLSEIEYLSEKDFVVKPIL